MFACLATEDFFRSRIDQMIDLRHPLAVLALHMPRQDIETRVTQVFARKGRSRPGRTPAPHAAHHDRAAVPQARVQ